MNPLFSIASTTAQLPHPAWVIPFILLLLSIAAFPLFAHAWWERNYGKVAFCLGMPTVIYYLFFLGESVPILHVVQEYISFIALIGALFVISGNIHIHVEGSSRPIANCAFLLGGGILANIIGTTGASMLLIRPWIRMNYYRINPFHIVFFIFIVSNVGGCLTPIGDPPLFLGFLAGIPFWWVLPNAFAPWAVMMTLLLAIFYVLDWRNHRRAPAQVREKQTRSESWSLDGAHNIFWLAVVLAAVFLQKPYGLREAIMVAACFGSYFTTPAKIRELNHFTFHPIQEVAILFAGIFAAMVPALQLLKVHAAAFHITSPLQYYFATGFLSAFLDNAPTYLTFLNVALGVHGLDPSLKTDVAQLVVVYPAEVLAISVASVFFGAMTYIGNGPNFMVRSIAEHAKIKMPTFGGYIFRYAVPYLLPALLLIGFFHFL